MTPEEEFNAWLAAQPDDMIYNDSAHRAWFAALEKVKKEWMEPTLPMLEAALQACNGELADRNGSRPVRIGYEYHAAKVIWKAMFAARTMEATT